MTLTQNQIQRRKGRVTASRVPAVLGLDPWCSPRQAWMKITGREEDTAGEAALIGQCFEEGVLQLFQQRTGKAIARRNIWRVCPDVDLGATLDAELKDEPALVEAKTTGIASRGNLADWGEDGTDEVPERTIAQTAGQFAAAPEKERAYVPAVLGGIGFRVYLIERDNNLVAIVKDRVARFIRDYLDTDRPPAPDWRDLEAVQALERRPTSSATLPDQLVKDYMEADDQEDKAAKRKGTLRALILDCMGESEMGVCELARVTYRRTKDSAKFDADAFKAAHPDLFSRFQKVQPGHRRFLVTAAKGGVA